ncbi:MAG: hypothetical protein JWL63_2477 [Rhodocyclales bacterium]|nr:hypothetical protein [Rhodocyclales bacterium]
MRCNLLLAALSVCFCRCGLAAIVQVDRSLDGQVQLRETVPPLQMKLVPIGTWRTGDQLAIRIVASNEVYNDITACIVSADAAKEYRAGSPCEGSFRSKTPIVIKSTVAESGSKSLILDNSYAEFITKNIVISLRYRKSLTDNELTKIQAPLEKIQSNLSAIFKGADFNLYVKSCGQSNAFSDHNTADITFCWELIQEFVAQNNNGALVATLLHEYGHSLLNRWGEPGSSEEDMADQFATVMLLKGGDNGRRMLQQWIQSWIKRDSKAEAMNQLQRGDTHSLSIQRARNIQNAMNFPEDLTRRWNKMLYRHMTTDTLDKIIRNPSKSDDVDLAKEARM